VIWLGIDPGKQLGIARVDVSQVIKVQMCDTWTDFGGFAQVIKRLGPEIIDGQVAVEGWEYQGAAKSRGVPHAAEAYGRVVGVLEALGVPYVTVKRGDVLSSLNLPRSAKKASVRSTIRALTSGARPRNDHEADAVAVAIAGANR
jgi:Holliday junction resolvasome RuvABC endonuclease subunit